MRRVLWLLVVTASCYSPQFAPGAPCDLAKDNCPSGLVCRDDGLGPHCEKPGGEVIDAPVGSDAADAFVPLPDGRPDAPGVADSDGDGVLDPSDNCPAIANAQQYNEDADGYGDACDPCPPFVDGATPIDPDGDGVSGLCDPNPMTPGDSIFLFDGFHGTALAASWRVFGTWTVANDQASADSGFNNHATAVSPSPPAAHETITTSVTITANHQANDDVTVGVLLQHQTGINSGIDCDVADMGAGGNKLALREAQNGNVFEERAFQFAVGETYLISMHRDSSQFTCTASSPNNMPLTIQDTKAVSPTQPEGGIRVENAAASYKWVLVVASPGP